MELWANSLGFQESLTHYIQILPNEKEMIKESEIAIETPDE